MPTKTHLDVLGDFEKLDQNEKVRLFAAVKARLYPLETNIRYIVDDLRETKFSGGIVCPHCTGNRIVRNGKLSGRQRYLCQDCRKTFNDFTNTPIQRSKLPGKWLQFLECMCKGLSLRKAAIEIGGVTHVTLFYWRHKILNALKNLDTDAFEGITEVDETYFLYSEKGQRKIPERASRKRGGSAKKRGISNEQVGVLVACDRQKQLFIKVAGSGRLSADKLDTMVADKLGADLILCSDADSAIRTFAAGHGLEHVELNARKKQRVKQGIFHIQHVNACHRQLKDWIRRFNGVATKYLDNYLAWFRFITDNKFEALGEKRKQMLIVASRFNVDSTCKSLRLASWDLAAK